jgi:uncharacterized protein YceK
MSEFEFEVYVQVNTVTALQCFFASRLVNALLLPYSHLVNTLLLPYLTSFSLKFVDLNCDEFGMTL